jgi:hypothetical protein
MNTFFDFIYLQKNLDKELTKNPIVIQSIDKDKQEKLMKLFHECISILKYCMFIIKQ